MPPVSFLRAITTLPKLPLPITLSTVKSSMHSLRVVGSKRVRMRMSPVGWGSDGSTLRRGTHASLTALLPYCGDTEQLPMQTSSLDSSVLWEWVSYLSGSVM